ncbi:hypothetical protein BOX15_Mlig003123g2 [Macrostomum lignano]|uniref:Transmembrane protein 245 n=1 Tax=Macrostomum lignano TaxID=282301 RepID=A0A267GEK9_9PLAT|nr:hypothetical protein BOX15_Mlig003123g2 [Macrostomum lignano]
MTSKPGENFSPLNYFYKFLPSSDDKALKQAFYNTIALAFVGIFLLACIAVYFILEAFIEPLLWALLVGSCLHPIKQKLTSLLKIWLKTTQESSKPLFVEAAILPFSAINSLLDLFYTKILAYKKKILVAIIVVPCVYLFLSLVPIRTHLELLITIWTKLSAFISIFSTTWILFGILLYLSLVLFYWTPESSFLLKLLALPVWIGVVFYVSSITGIFSVPLFISFISLVCLGCIVEIRDSLLSGQNYDFASLLSLVGSNNSPSTAAAVAASAATGESESDDPVDLSDETPQEQQQQQLSTEETAISDENLQPIVPSGNDDNVDAASPSGGTSTPAVRQQQQPPPPPPPLQTRRRVSRSMSCGVNADRLIRQKQRRQQQQSRSSKTFFVLLLWGHALVYAWTRPWTLSLLPFVAAFVALRTLGDSIGGSQLANRWASSAYRQAMQLVESRREALAPFPVRGIYKLLLRGDRKMSDILTSSLDAIVSIFVILLVLSASVFLTIFLAIQVQRESIELVTMTSRVLNNTVITASNTLLPETDNLQKLLDSMMGNAYVFGREWISKKINMVFETNDYNKAKIEEQVLQLWDRLYEKLAAKNFTWSPVWRRVGEANDSTDGNPPGSQRPGLSRQSSVLLFSGTAVWELWGSLLDSNKMMSFIKENLGILTSVLESLWIVIKGNLSLLLTLLTTALSILFGGGTAVLNFLLQSLVFLTSLYLLLCFSNDMYLPVQFISSMSSNRPNSVFNALYSALEDATSGVFLASMKMSCFYGLYTSLTHTVFAVNLVFAPSVLAAIFGAIPFLGAYWASAPGALELWLIHGQPLLAAAFVLLHLLPSYLVDPTIYGEIKGAGHPYLTGLSVAGGLYWCGLDGAIFGPILLACLLAAVNTYRIVLSPPQATGSAETQAARASESSATNIRRTVSMFDHNKKN